MGKLTSPAYHGIPLSITLIILLLSTITVGSPYPFPSNLIPEEIRLPPVPACAKAQDCLINSTASHNALADCPRPVFSSITAQFTGLSCACRYDFFLAGFKECINTEKTCNGSQSDVKKGVDFLVEVCERSGVAVLKDHVQKLDMETLRNGAGAVRAFEGIWGGELGMGVMAGTLVMVMIWHI